MRRQNTLVLFDFDGTITSKDTLLKFTRFACGNFAYFLGLALLAIPLTLHKINLIDAQKAKELFLGYYFKGLKYSYFNEKCEQFGKQILPKIIRPLALEAIRNHQNRGSRILIVTASANEWISAWAIQNGIEVIATQLEIKNGELTGKILGKNCNGNEKVSRLREVVELDHYDEIVAYGDSKGDMPMLKIAHQKFYKPFR